MAKSEKEGTETITVKVQQPGGTSNSVPLDLKAGDGTLTERIKAAVGSNGVVVFGKTWCPFCLEVRNTFDSLGVKYAVYNVDAETGGGEVHSCLKELYKQTTVPYVFVGGEFVGGCTDLKALHNSGQLEPRLRKAKCIPTRTSRHRQRDNLAMLEGRNSVPGTLFAFPEALDDRAVRLNGIWGFVICLLVAIYHEKAQAHWVMVGLMVDFILRFIGGGNISPLGSLSTVCVAVMDAFGGKPKFIAGPPKQFATLCGIMFSAMASFFYLMEVHEWKLVWVGLAFTCALGAATALEGFIGFCLGCFFFSLMIQFGILPKTMYTVFTSIKDEVEYTWEDMNKRLNEGPAERHVKHRLDSDHPLRIDYKYKAKTDDQTKEDFHIIKHVKITHFLMHMGMAGCACAWQFATPWETLYAPAPVAYAIALGAAFFFVVWLVLYAIKLVTFPNKVAKEWQCNLRGNSFVVPFVTTVLFAYLVNSHSNKFAKVLFWIGAPSGLFVSLYRVGDWLATRKDLEHVNAAWMIMPVSNFVAAMVGPIIDPKYTDACQFWFGFAFVMWLALFALTFVKSIIQKHDDDRLRPLLAIWVASPSVMGVAYLSCWVPDWMALYNNEGAMVGDFNDFIFINLMWFSVALTLVLLVGFYKPYFGRLRFDMSYWAASFPSDALAFICIAYNLIKPGRLSGGIAFAALAACSVVTVVLCAQTLAGILRLRVFVPDYKWGPLSFMKLTHEAFRGAVPKLLQAAKAVAEGDNSDDATATLEESWRLFALMHEEHSQHEDRVIFKTYNDYFPQVAGPYNNDHDHHHDELKKITEAVTAACKGGAGAGGLMQMLEKYCEDLEKHLRGEEDHLQGMPRKWIPLELHKQIVRKCWELTPAETWAEYLPWAVNSLPMLHQRVRFIKTFLWAMPERAQHIGIMLATGVDAVQWKRITDELPEIIPRGAPGWERYY
mmetsp:Transcript_38079/g.84818  ORF Transcript_38079/g.84818 Transcript_38079/m.84818 type:complete len:945 (+) Transcript_38079:211-3045(+)|eukprot:CAMPEP_0202901956 /NCGR_PEP_ID=MMETSP1392-20130828/15529_1 /ASSEMBLY_ACC=CAM_ASM_000868 /TAXON_ID=225041 /ORGANISM="Chlamydomonas chlamydogama, Strain SAG 11-48b" /LENGTH=944 /DNA_ID=CAMNT_0049588625 /DNA_START=203 /DNA_END=3037 /DNA_ORIENTATION=+